MRGATTGSMWVTGRHPVEELLASATQRARKVLLSDAVPKEARAGFEKRAKELALPCLTCPRQEWERRTGEREGGGIAAEIAEYVYAGMEEWVSALPGTARVFLLDGITDPGNLGAIVRSARAFAFDGVVLPADRSCPVTGAVFRASAGAAAHVPVVQVTNLVRAIERLQEAGFWLYAAEGDGRDGSVRVRPREADGDRPRERGEGDSPAGAGAVRRRRPDRDGPRGRVAERLRRRGDHRLFHQKIVDISRRIASNSKVRDVGSGARRRSSTVERLICNQMVGGSTPLVGSNREVEGYPSGQRGQTVNLLATPTEVRILPPPPSFARKRREPHAPELRIEPNERRRSKNRCKTG